MLGLLIEFNRSWVKDAPVPSHSHSADAGSAWAHVSLQATRMGWHTHGMVGFDMERAFADLGFCEGYRVEMAFAVGRKDDKGKLPEALQQREMPSDRLALSEVVFEGKITS